MYTPVYVLSLFMCTLFMFIHVYCHAYVDFIFTHI